MRKILAISILLGSTLIGSAAMTQTGQLGVDAELPGKSLKWIHIAEQQFKREKLDLDKYTVTVFEEDEHVTVILTSFDAPKRSRGSAGTYPAYEVEISKKTMKIIRANYTR
jgi:hypothetical protein